MPTIRVHLRQACQQLEFERRQLDIALQLAKDSGYEPPWVHAIEHALNLNLDADRHLSNLFACIKHPADASLPYSRRPSIQQEP